MSVSQRRFPAVAAALAALITSSLSPACGGGSPSSSTPPVTVAPAPTPTPTPVGNPGAASCPLGEGSPSAECGEASSRLLDAVTGAMEQLVRQSPQIFDKADEAGAGTGQFRVLDKEAYLSGLVANLTAGGYCAERDPGDYTLERLLVKNENGFSEAFDVLTSQGFMRRAGSYLETCTPASFPVDRSDLPPAGSGCGAPYPPPISRMNCKLHLSSGGIDLLDSTAIVGHDAAYCASVGFPDRSLCPVRPENSPERLACEAWRVGHAKDTGRPGPTWTVNGKFCTGQASGCENHPTNQHQLLVYASGTYQVCSQTGSCCSVEVER
jgi:hypothetical protein